jgi:hypothetical protein
VEESRSPIQLDREVMAMMLVTNVQLVADVLRRDEHASGQVMRAIAATRSLDMIVEDSLRALVEQARAAGHTWAEIGQVLRVSRQAAFQRFGSARSPGLTENATARPVKDAAQHAVPVLEAFLDGRWDDARTRFDERMLKACSAELLAGVREQMRDLGGELEALGDPEISVRDGYTIVDIPISLERRDGTGRVVLDADHKVAGFFIRPAEALA